MDKGNPQRGMERYSSTQAVGNNIVIIYIIYNNNNYLYYLPSMKILLRIHSRLLKP
jgi:hypothetical protein